MCNQKSDDLSHSQKTKTRKIQSSKNYRKNVREKKQMGGKNIKMFYKSFKNN